MAFTEIEENEIETGKPVSATTQTKIKENLDDHEARIQTIESGVSVTYPPIIMRVNGTYTPYVGEGILKTTTNFNITITGVRLLVDKAGPSGTTEINLKYSRDGGAYTSILSTTPRVDSTAGDDAKSDGSSGTREAVLNDAEVNIQAGDIIALDIVSTQASGAAGFMVRIDFIGA